MSGAWCGRRWLQELIQSPMVRVVLNRAASNLDDFLQGPGNESGAIFADPTITVLPGGLFVQFDDYSGQLDGDGPRFRFDVQTSGGDIAPIPLPAEAALLASDVLGLGALRRRRAAR